MPSFSNLLVAGLFAAGSLALPAQKASLLGRQSGSCLSDSDAQQVATNWINILGLIDGWEDIANAALTDDFTDYSESVNTLIDSCPQGADAMAHLVPLLGPSFSNRSALISGQGQQPPLVVTQLNIWSSCDTVIIRWGTNDTAPIPNPRPVIGLISMETVPAPAGNQYPYQISTLYSEFDAGAWLQNLDDAGICPNGDINPDGSDGTTTSAAPGPTTTPAGNPSVITQTITATHDFGAGPTPFTWTTTFTQGAAAATGAA